MQGDISMKSVAEFIPVFFKELRRDGLIDRAVAAARGAIAGSRPDWWAPTLFMRLKSGRIWYVPGFQDDPQGFKKWPTLLGHISGRKCLPIIGPGAIEPLVGSTRDMARRWADVYRYTQKFSNSKSEKRRQQFFRYTRNNTRKSRSLPIKRSAIFGTNRRVSS